MGAQCAGRPGAADRAVPAQRSDAPRTCPIMRWPPILPSTGSRGARRRGSATICAGRARRNPDRLHAPDAVPVESMDTGGRPAARGLDAIRGQARPFDRTAEMPGGEGAGVAIRRAQGADHGQAGLARGRPGHVTGRQLRPGGPRTAAPL